MITVLHQPEELQPVLNPIAYRVHTDQALTTYIALRLLVETEFGAGDFYTLVEQEAQPDEQREATFYIDANLAAALSPQLPDHTNPAPQSPSKTLLRYRVAFAEITDTQPLAAASFVQQPDRYAIYARIPYQQYPTSKAIADTPLLTSRPLARRLYPTQPDFLTLLSPSDSYAPTATITLTYQNDTTQVVPLPLPTLAKYQICYIPIGIPQRAYPNPENIKKIAVSLADTIVEYTIAPQPDRYQTATLAYLCRYTAAAETVFCEGDSELIAQPSALQAETFPTYDHTPTQKQTNEFGLRIMQSGKLTTGYMPTAEHQAAAGLMYSAVVHLLKADQATPINLSRRETITNKESERLKAYEIQYQTAYEL